ncbi:MAG TPA: RNA polymerase sigma-54 factor, partial [Leptospiraceae bacterium]|nr:RNA polymerase sigma-54 factor [Leptospiraceae bacterium]
MGLSQGLYQKQTQKLVLTQDLRNSIKLLELSNIELSEKIEFELEENPLLEEVYNPEKSKLNDLLSVYEKKKSEELDSFKSTDVAWQETAAYDMRRGDSDASNRNQKFIESSAFAKNLGEYLMEQIRLTSLTENEVLLAEELISMLDGKGFIPESPEEIAELASVPADTVRKILNIMHRLDPLGIGARDIQQSL